ncbi:MAG: NADH-quinone oxidoreductase subunit J [Anaerolineaceae bacterium]|nr:NADH-quinone oxidoreductase subunit J [Anaerolineaceae bacterium]
MPGQPIVFFILALVALGTALGMLTSRNAVYSALFLVLNFATVAMLYLILGAPFIALSQITVYAGSIMVLFLFVIMLLGAERLPAAESLRWHPLVAIPLGLVLAGEFAYQIFVWSGHLSAVAIPPADFGAPKAMGELLFTHYMLPVEITAVILLSATVGAIMLAKADKPTIRQGARGADTTPQEEAPKS